jgi:hypothetical protein
MERNNINNGQEASKRKVGHFCIFGTAFFVPGIFCINYYAIELINKKEKLGVSLSIALGVGIFVLGFVLLGLGVSCFIVAHKEWHKYQMKNGLLNHNLQFEDIEHLIPQLLPVILPEIEKYMNGCRIEEIDRRDNVTDIAGVST